MADSRTSDSTFGTNTLPQQQQQQPQPEDLERAYLLLKFTNHLEGSPTAANDADDERNNEGEGTNAAPSSAPPAPATSFSSISPASYSSSLSSAHSDDDDDATHKICTRPRCPHNKVPLPLPNFQETNKRGEVITWKHCKECRTKHAKEDRERKHAKRAAAKAKARDDENEDDDDHERNGKRLVVTLRASLGALRILKAGGRIEGEIAETFADGPTLVLKGGAVGRRPGGGDSRRSSTFGKRAKDEDSSDGEWGLHQVRKRRKSIQKGASGKARKEKKKIVEEEELGPEESVNDSGTNAEEETDKKRGEKGAKGKK